MSEYRFEVTQEDVGSRLDLFLSRMSLELSRNQVQRLIDNNCILVNDKPQKSSYKLRLKDQIQVFVPPPPPVQLQPEPLSLDVVFEDDHLIVLSINPLASWCILPPVIALPPSSTGSSIIATIWLTWEGH